MSDYNNLIYQVLGIQHSRKELLSSVFFLTSVLFTFLEFPNIHPDYGDYDYLWWLFHNPYASWPFFITVTSAVSKTFLVFCVTWGFGKLISIDNLAKVDNKEMAEALVYIDNAFIVWSFFVPHFNKFKRLQASPIVTLSSLVFFNVVLICWMYFYPFNPSDPKTTLQILELVNSLKVHKKASPIIRNTEILQSSSTSAFDGISAGDGLHIVLPKCSIENTNPSEPVDLSNGRIQLQIPVPAIPRASTSSIDGIQLQESNNEDEGVADEDNEATDTENIQFPEESDVSEGLTVESRTRTGRVFNLINIKASLSKTRSGAVYGGVISKKEPPKTRRPLIATRKERKE